VLKKLNKNKCSAYNAYHHNLHSTLITGGRVRHRTLSFLLASVVLPLV
jgi:hypothetical protein